MKNIALGYVYKNKDEKNKIELTDEQMHLYMNGNEETFPLDVLKELTIETKYLLGPIVIGAVGASLSLIALMSYMKYPLLLLSLLLGGLIAFYYGVKGHPFLIIKEKGNEQKYFLKEITPFFREMIDFVNAYLTYRKKHIHKLYFFISPLCVPQNLHFIDFL